MQTTFRQMTTEKEKSLQRILDKTLTVKGYLGHLSPLKKIHWFGMERLEICQ